MIKWVLFAGFVFLFGILPAQSVSTDYIFRIKPVLIPKLLLQDVKDKVIIKMPFGSDSILNPAAIRMLDGKMVTRVELVYTSFKTDQHFDQPELNRNRIASLRKLAPSLFENSFIEWKVVAQTAAKDIETAKTYFHGFIITTEEFPSVFERKDEVSKIEDMVKHVKIPVYDTIFKERKKRYYLPVSKRKRDKGITYKKKGIWNREMVTEVVIKPRIVQVGEIDSVFINDEYKHTDARVKIKNDSYVIRQDSTIYSVLKRNKWDEMMLVIDVTGSMGVYTQQILKWIALETNLKRVKHVVCFNDGDTKKDKSKVKGSTGGIYHSEDATLASITEIMMKAMRNGSGGDSPENNVEAIMDGIKTDPNCKEIILIADNWANMRDYSMIADIKKPVRVIICGNSFGINTQYLDLARVTHGSVHTMEEDLMQLFKLNEGEEIKIGKQVYQIIDGKFVLVSQT